MKSFVLHIIRGLVVATIVYFATFNIFAFLAKPVIEKYEKQLIDTDINFLIHALNNHSNHVAILADDWSYWDDAYVFVKDLNTKFIDTNLNTETLRNADINMVVFLDSKGSVIYKKTIALEKGQVVEIPGDIYKENSNNSLYKEVLGVISSKNGVSKNIQTGQGLLTYSIYPILKSTGEGPVNGAIFLGRYFNTADTDTIKLETNADFEVRNFVNAESNLQQNLIKKDSTYSYGTYHVTINKLIKDSRNSPSLYLIFRHPRFVNYAFNELLPVLAGISALIAFIGDFIVAKSKHIVRGIKKV